jgi:hypothetical protein
MLLDYSELYWFAAPRAGVIQKKVKRHGTMASCQSNRAEVPILFIGSAHAVGGRRSGL